jgi:hypothetical protein
VAGGSYDQEHHAHHGEDYADDPQDLDVQEKPEQKQDDT